MMKFPFEAEIAELVRDLDRHVDAVFGSLESEFLVMPRGEGFVEYSEFEGAFQVLRRTTRGFATIEPGAVTAALRENALVLIVLRAMLGFTSSEWAYAASRHGSVAVSQGYARSLDRRARTSGGRSLEVQNSRVEALVAAACDLLTAGAPAVDTSSVHRLAKADTAQGLVSVRHLADLGAPYALVLYERFLGRPFAGHRDSVSELVGGRLEARIEEILVEHGVCFRKTRRAEKIAGFDQTPDFVVPDEFNPRVVIEAKNHRG